MEITQWIFIPPRPVADFPDPGTDEAILRRWGLNGGDLVDRTALGAQLSRLIVDEALRRTSRAS